MAKRIYGKKEVVEYRRIFKSGDSFVISIPRLWLKQNKIEIGDEIECQIKGDRIIILTKKWEGENGR